MKTASQTPAKIAIIGGGAAGYFLAANLKHQPHLYSVDLFEATAKPLTKVKISGGGRCNVTHFQFDPKELIKNYPRGQRELLSTFYRFNPEHTVQWFREHGVDLVAEKDGRMFATTNKSQTIIDCLQAACESNHVRVHLQKRLDRVEKDGDDFLLTFKDATQQKVQALVLATGSAPIGHRLIPQLDHSLSELAPSLFTFKISHPLLEGLAGQAFASCELKLKIQIAGQKKPQIFQQTGPCLMTHWGLSGPSVLKLSAFAARSLQASGYNAQLQVNWQAGMNFDSCKQLLQQLKKDNPSQILWHKPEVFDFSKRFWQRLCELQGLNQKQTWQACTQKQINTLAQMLTDCPLQVQGKGIFKEEFVTCGGVKLKEIDFQSMQSKKHKNLFFAGEVLDVDGITGGFNFQNAWSSAFLIATHLQQQFAV